MSNLPVGSSTVAHKYKVGDSIKVRGKEAIVKELSGVNSLGVPEYYVIYSDGDYEYIQETIIGTTSPAWIKPKECWCGLDSTGAGGHHSDYCPKYKEKS